MKILFVWTGVTSYMADCWRKLQQEPGVELKVVVEQVASGKEFDAARVLQGLDYTLVQTPQTYQTSQTSQTFSPDVIFAVGWHSKLVRSVVTCAKWADVPKVCCFDLPWRWSLRCFAARFVLRPFLRHYAAAYVPGRACERYAKWLGFRKIYKGLFSIDVKRFRAEGIDTGTQGRRKGFLYVGRFSTEKKVDVLIEAYERYRELGGTWSLDLYGSGTLPKLPNLSNPSNLSNLSNLLQVHPFVQPDGVPRLYADHACLLLASAFDPWPLVALEARASGCEVIQSDRCGNRFELDTRIVRFGNVEAMAREMLAVERGDEPKRATAENLEEYDCGTWARRTLEIAKGLVK